MFKEDLSAMHTIGNAVVPGTELEESRKEEGVDSKMRSAQGVPCDLDSKMRFRLGVACAGCEDSN